MATLLIKNARVICPAQGMDQVSDLFVRDGVIETPAGSDATADMVIDARGLIAAPGLVDMHVHLRDPGQTYKEDIITGCNAAAAGGVTSLLAMPNCDPVTDSGDAVSYILEKAKKAKAKVYAAASISKGLASKQATDLQEVKQAGAIALTDDGRPVEDTKMLAEAMVNGEKLGLKVVAHCEDLYLAKGGIINQGSVSRQLGVAGIPAAAEDCGTAREIALAAAYNVPVHICHVSTATSVALVRDAKRRGVPVTAETAPHYVALTETELLKRDADYRMNPPLRTEQDKQAVIQGLRDGTLDVIATDHAPHSTEDKANFETAPNGAIGMETSLAAGLTYLVKPGLLSLNKLIEAMSTRPAEILGIPAGSLAVGTAADIVLFDPEEVWTVDVEKLHGKSKNTPFKGLSLQGKVKYTFLNGEQVYKDV